MRFALKKCPITAQGISLGTTGYVDDFACHLLKAGVQVGNMAAVNSGPSSRICKEKADGEPRKNWSIHKCGKSGRGKARRSRTDRTTRRGVECDADGR